MGSQPPMPTFKEFQRATSGGMFRGRDDFHILDQVLSQMEQYGTSMTGKERMGMLKIAMDEGQRWMSDKKTKLDNNSTSLVRKRAAAVEQLLAQLGERYRFESFLAGKAGGRVDQQKGMELRGLQGEYAFEATAQPKGVAHPSASHVKEYAEKKGMNIQWKETYVAARDAYVADPKVKDAKEQIYYNRAGRMAHLLMVIKGKLSTGPDALASLAGPFAMDEYGNLFAQEMPDKDPRSFNHSSFCRGKQVVCAGTLDIYQGALLQITNMSGHYKPRPIHLANTLRILSAAGLDLSNTDIMCVLGAGTSADRAHCGNHAAIADCVKADGMSGMFTKVVFGKALGFMANPDGHGLPIVDQKTFKSAAEAKAAMAKARVEFAHVQ
jgi:hypothetical protein